MVILGEVVTHAAADTGRGAATFGVCRLVDEFDTELQVGQDNLPSSA